MPAAERFSDPLPERLMAFVRSIGIEVHAAPPSHGVSWDSRMAAAKGVVPFPHMLRWLR